MRFVSASDDLRRAAEQLQFQYKDLIPDPSKPKTWRVPKQTLGKTPAFWDFMQFYNQEVSPDVVQWAKSRGRQIKIKRGPTWYLMGRGYLTGPNELFVGFIGEVPCASTSSGVTMSVANMDAEVPEGENAQKSRAHGGFQHGVQENLKTGIADATPWSQQLLTELETTIMAALTAKLEFVVRKDADVRHSADLPALRVGDRIELTSLEELDIKSGLIPILAMAYEEYEIKDGAGDEEKG